MYACRTAKGDKLAPTESLEEAHCSSVTSDCAGLVSKQYQANGHGALYRAVCNDDEPVGCAAGSWAAEARAIALAGSFYIIRPSISAILLR